MSSGWASVIIAGMSLIGLGMAGIVRSLWKGGVERGQILAEIKQLAENNKKVAEQLERHIDWHLGNRTRRTP